MRKSTRHLNLPTSWFSTPEMRRKAGDDHHKHDDDDDNCNGGDDDDDGGGVGDNDDLEQQLSQGELWNQTLLEPPRSSVPGC